MIDYILKCIRSHAFDIVIVRLHGTFNLMKVTTSKDLGALVRDQRTQLGWTQGALAARVGVSRLWIFQVEKGKTTTRIGLVLRTLKELGVVLDASASAIEPSHSSRNTAVNLDQIIKSTLLPKP